jgi:kinesin family protein 15
MLEIYNEVITDLVNPDATNLQIREDIKRGCYVEDLSSHSVQNGEAFGTQPEQAAVCS